MSLPANRQVGHVLKRCLTAWLSNLHKEMPFQWSPNIPYVFPK